MRPLAAAVLALLIAIPVSAAPKKAKPKTRSLDSVIELALSDGQSRRLGPTVIKELEIGNDSMTDGQVPTMLIQYEQIVCPDDQKHSFQVAYRDGKKKEPLFLVFAVYQGRREGETILADGYEMKVSVDGHLEKIISIKGVVKHATHTNLDPKSPESISAFKHEFDFYTKDSLSLERTKS